MRGSQSRTRPWRTAHVAVVVAALAGLACFARGFFPVKPLLAGFSPAQDYTQASRGQYPAASERSDAFSRLAFVVVDALRADFAFGPESHMTFVQSLVDSGQALPYTAVAQAPTVTLPRLKALTTGSNPTFLDSILNVVEESITSASFERVDSWVKQIAMQGKKVVFAGDDTWLRLFPKEWFDWTDGVSSFFVSDTVTVDTNVTRHLDSLLTSPSQSEPRNSALPPADWDVLILHYLGLDHVGHLGGPRSSLMPLKQQEMDRVAERIYRDLERRDAEDGQRSLLVLVGDHGMTEGGNHGGSTEAETSAALLLTSPGLRVTAPSPLTRHASSYRLHEVVQQIDLVPTLALLNSMGKLLPSAIETLRPAALAQALAANVQQLSGVLLTSGGDAAVDQLAQEAAKDSTASLADLLGSSVDVQHEFLRLAQDRLLASSSSYQLFPLYTGLLILVFASIGALSLCRRVWQVETKRTRWTVGLALVAYLGSFFATSFIEEEHELWYFFGATGLVFLAIRPTFRWTDRLTLILAAASVRIYRSWAHNGQKNLPNTSLSLTLSSRPRLTFALIVLSYAVPLIVAFSALTQASRAFARSRPTVGQAIAKSATFAVFAVLTVAQVIVGLAMHWRRSMPEESQERMTKALEKHDLDNAEALSRAGCWICGVAWVALRLTKRRDAAQQGWSTTLTLVHASLLLMSLTRPSNVPLVCAFWIQHAAVSLLAKRADASPAQLAFLVAAFQAAGFFGLGGSNSLASVDLSQAYNGLSFYSFPLVSLLTYLSNFSLPILHSLSLHTIPHPLRSLTLRYLTAFHTLALATLATSATWFGYHLFSLTVFAPAVLYRVVWFGLVHLGTNLVLARLLVGE
ncbi:GPI ethanolamine phosphate transferase 2 [Rhodotorula toruloides]|uniref:GPI ethanolamine phosphate transferase 2 n=1 Tax=Rhodotorula toruloides TaxID=5286 RepID=A0A0K3CEC3_RHOTO|nr:GPI ethanolamine phosphate transferase 2 [Rhodotorula toruloides]PRQ75070.1 Alkaline-phosphatase-like, core domain-containing protein [Rhodotorula toruloides]